MTHAAKDESAGLLPVDKLEVLPQSWLWGGQTSSVR
jgi:hypothetical protein